MRRLAIACVATILSTTTAAGADSPADAVSIEGVTFPQALRASDIRLELRNVGLLRYRMIFKGYVAGLYLGAGLSPRSVLDDVPKRLEIEYFWAIEAADFARATADGIERNVAADTLAPLRPRIERLNALYRDVQPGDRYALTYLPESGTALSLNGRTLGTIEGEDFARAVFSIWFGEDPLDEALKETLLSERG